MAKLPPRLVPARMRVTAQPIKAVPPRRGIAPTSAPFTPSPPPVQPAPGPFSQWTAPEAPMSTARLQIFTRFTQAEIPILIHTGGAGWTRIKLTLEDAGPVVVGTGTDLFPVLSGKGMLLPSDAERDFVLREGDSLYIAADAPNRVAVVIEPIPESVR